MTSSHTSSRAVIPLATGRFLLTSALADATAAAAVRDRSLAHRILDGLGDFSQVTLASDGSVVALAGQRSAACFATEGGDYLLWQIYAEPVVDLALSLDDAYLAIASGQTVQLWEVANQRLLGAYNHPAPVAAVTLGQDSVFTGCEDGYARGFRIDQSGGRCRRRYWHGKAIDRVHVDADRLYTASHDGRLRRFNVTTGRCEAETRDNDSINSISLSGSPLCGSVALWESQRLKRLHFNRRYGYRTNSIAVSADRIVCGDFRGRLHIHDGVKGRHLKTLPVHSEAVQAVALSADSRYAATISTDATAKITCLASKRPIQVISATVSPLIVAYLGVDGSLLLGGYNPQLKRYDLQSGECTLSFSGHTGWLADIACAETGLIATASHDASVKLWQPDGSCCATLPHSDVVHAVCLSKDGSYLYTGGRDAKVRLFATHDKRCLQTLAGGYGAWIRSLDLDPTEHFLCSVDNMGCVDLFQLTTPDRAQRLMTLTGHAGIVHTVRFNPVPDRAVWLATTSGDGTLRLWGRGGVCLRRLAHSMGARGLAFSPDGGQLLSGGYDGTLRLWDPVSGSRLQVIEDAHSTWIRSVCFLDSQRAVSAGCDGQLRIWNLAEGRLLATLYHLDHGFLWTTPADDSAASGYVWTNREDLVEVIGLAGEDSEVTVLTAEDPARRDYLAIYNNAKAVMQRVWGDSQNPSDEMLALQQAVNQADQTRPLLEWGRR